MGNQPQRSVKVCEAYTFICSKYVFAMTFFALSDGTKKKNETS